MLSKLFRNYATRQKLSSQQEVSFKLYSISYKNSGGKNLVANIDSCLRQVNNDYRNKNEKEFHDGLVELKEFCSQLNDETEGKLSERSWNFLIQQFCRNEAFTDQGVFWFKRMKEKKVANANSYTLQAVLKSFSLIGDLYMCEEILEELEREGERNVFSYIYYTKTCLQNGKSEKAFNVIERMKKYGIEPNLGIYIPLVKEATKCNLQFGLKLYDMIKKSGLTSFQLSCCLANFGVKMGRPEIAIEEYENMKNQGLMNVVTWNCLIQAYIQQNDMQKAIDTITEMKNNGIKPDDRTFTILITKCANSNLFEEGVKIHEIANRILGEFTIELSNSTINFYTKCGYSEKAIEECEKVKKKGRMDVVTWTCLIQAYIQQNDTKKAIDTLYEMKNNGIRPDERTFTILITKCANSNLFEEGVKIHEIAKRILDEFTIELSNSTINFYTKCGYSEKAIEECEKVKKKGRMDVVTWNCLIQAYIQQNDIKKAIDTLYEMQNNDITPNIKVFTIVLRTCAKLMKYEEGVKMHELAKETIKEFPIELSTSIINFYTKCGHSDIAIQECYKLLKTGARMDVVTWTCLIQAYIQQNDIKKAIDTITEMKNNGINPNSTTFAILIAACANSNLYEVGLEIYELAKETIKEFSIELSTSIINFYTKCGYSDNAIQECEKLKNQGLMNVVTWTCLIQAYIQQNDMQKAIDTITEMKNNGIKPDDRTFIVLITACANSNLYEVGLEIYEVAKETIKEFSIELSASIINFYTKCGYSDIAIEECEKLKKKGYMDVVTWTCLIQAYIQQNDTKKAIDTLYEMKNNGINPNSTTFAILITACANSNLYEVGLEIYEVAKETIKEFPIELSTSIINFYTKCRYSDIAIEECEKLKNQGLMNVVTWTCLIQAYIQQNDTKKAIDTLYEMKNNGINPNSTTFAILITACANSNLYEVGLEIYELAKETIKEFPIELSTSIINFYTKCGYSDIAIEECEKLKNQGLMNVVTWTCLIQAYIQRNDVNNSTHIASDVEHKLNMAFRIYNEMKAHGIEPNSYTFTILMSACGEYVASNIGLEIIKDINESKMGIHEEVISGMVYFYSRIGQTEAAQQLFNQLLKKQQESKQALSVITYTNMLASYAHHGKGDEAKKLFEEMIERKVEFDEITLVVLLNAYSHSGMVEEAIQLYNNLESIYNIKPTLSIDCVMVDVFSRAGRFKEAEKLIGDRNDIDLWGAMMGGCRKFKNIELGEKVFKKITEIDETQASSYVLLSHIYTYHGLNEKANKLQKLMQRRGIKKLPGIVYHEENGTIFKFISGSDNYMEDPEMFEKIERMRDDILGKIIKSGYRPDTRWVTRTESLSEEEKVQLLFRHAEKTAIAHAFVLNPSRKKIILTNNLRVCNDCHSATAFISKVMEVEIIVRDANRYHHFKDGKCSCADYW